MIKLKVGILGATGYTGIELLKALDSHPNVNIIFLGAHNVVGKTAINFISNLKNFGNIKIKKNESIKNYELDVIFSCLPHGELAKNLKKFKINKETNIIDLSADFRLPDKIHNKWYKKRPKLINAKKFKYVLPEISKNVAKGNIANPGCYATSILLGLSPLAKDINKKNIIVDTKSGVSGAGKSNKTEHIFNEANENLSTYAVGSHKHKPEIEYILKKNFKSDINLLMVPHLLPITRGILSNIYIQFETEVNINSIHKKFTDFYKNQKFIKVFKDELPAIKDVQFTNNCHIGLKTFKNSNVLLVSAVIDNLIKGASGQAVQNMNLMYSLDESLGF